MKHLLFFTLFLCTLACQPEKNIEPIASSTPNKYQQEQIKRKYGMFLHFGLNTFEDEEWTDGTKPSTDYAPESIDVQQWIKAAKDAGMKYVILTVKHHDGFCLWDSQYTDYDVENSGNKTNVVEAIAKECKKQNIGLGLYYSLWDRHENGNIYNEENNSSSKYIPNQELDDSYNKYMIQQLKELINITNKYTPLVEFWFDGGWVKENYRWPIAKIYQTIKEREPQCQIGINWSIGLPDNPDAHGIKPTEQKEGYPIRYFPSDFRLGDPMLPGENDPKLFSHKGQLYYMPWESTICLSNRWFYNTKDSTYKSVEELEILYKKTTSQNNILILNCPPNRKGKLRDKDIQILKQLHKEIKQ